MEREMTIIQKIKDKARLLKRQINALYYAYGDKRLGILPKVLIALAILYALSPIDLIPDFIPVLGYLDDLILLPGLIAIAIRLIPAEIWEDAIARAEREPVTLRQNWAFGIFTVAIWILLFAWLARVLLRLRQ